MKRIFTLFLALSLFLCSCSSTPENPGTESTSEPTEAVSINVSDLFSQKDTNTDSSDSVAISLKGKEASCEDKGVHLSGNTVTIRSAGKYLLSGTLEGNVIVEVGSTDDVHLILRNAHILSDSSAALWVKQADKVILTLEGENSLESTGTLEATSDSNVDGVLFSKDDLSLNGEGSLQISSPGHGIVCKKDLVISAGSYEITGEKHSISAKNSLRIAGGSFRLTAGADGLHAENAEEADKGYLYIGSGSFHIQAQQDAISASNSLQIDGGTFGLESGGGYKNAAPHASGFPGSRNPAATQSSANTVSTKGIKAGGDLLINGGSFTINTADDAIHGNSNVSISRGEFVIQSGDDAIHAEEQLLIQNGSISILTSYEGLEGHCIDISGGTIELFASDDGLNAAGGNDGSGFGRNDMFANDKDAYISISGGTLKVNASGDGIDSNGALTVSGGEIYVSGPTNNGNGALDFAGEAKITGGIFIAAGASGMASGFGTSSTQGVIFVSYSTQKAGSLVSLKNSAGEEILSWTTEKDSSSIVLSCPEIKQGESYQLTVGEIQGEIVMTELVYGYSNSQPGGPGGHGGRPGGR